MNELVNQVLWPVARPLAWWARTSQRGACRNAMVASSSLAAGRRERDEVEEFLAALFAARPDLAGSPPDPFPVARLG